MPADLVATERLGNLNDPSYELLLRRELGCCSIGTRLTHARLRA
jgi:hypothetical protein